MPKCQRCGKTLKDDEFFLCSDCEVEGLYLDVKEYEENTIEFIDEEDDY